jgi:hypothetical protein
VPVADLYATPDQLAARVPSQFGASAEERTDEQQAAAESLLEAISRAIDSVTKRTAGAFTPSPTEPSARVIYGNGKSCLEMPEHIPETVRPTITTIQGETPPKFAEYRGMLCVTDSRGVLSRRDVWPEGVPFTVTARWGYPQTPADIREACLVWAAQRARMNSGDTAGMVTSIARDGATIQRDDIPPVVRELLKPFVLAETEEDNSGTVEFGALRSSDFR